MPLLFWSCGNNADEPAQDGPLDRRHSGVVPGWAQRPKARGLGSAGHQPCLVALVGVELPLVLIRGGFADCVTAFG